VRTPKILMRAPGLSITSFPHLSFHSTGVPEIMNSSIPVYNADGSLYACVSEVRFNRLNTAGLIARTVQHKKGHINRAILRGSPDDPTPLQIGAYQGTRHIYRQKLESGRRCWQHKKPDVMFMDAGQDRAAL
jgi:hypothetical protein